MEGEIDMTDTVKSVTNYCPHCGAFIGEVDTIPIARLTELLKVHRIMDCIANRAVLKVKAMRKVEDKENNDKNEKEEYEFYGRIREFSVARPLLDDEEKIKNKVTGMTVTFDVFSERNHGKRESISFKDIIALNSVSIEEMESIIQLCL